MYIERIERARARAIIDALENDEWDEGFPSRSNIAA